MEQGLLSKSPLKRLRLLAVAEVYYKVAQEVAKS